MDVIISVIFREVVQSSRAAPNLLGGMARMSRNVARLELTRFRGRYSGREGGFQCRKTHPPYAPEYRRRISSWQAQGARLQELARVRAVGQRDPQTVRQAGLDEGLRSDGLTSSESDELQSAAARNRVPRGERDTIKSRRLVRDGDRSGAPPGF